MDAPQNQEPVPAAGVVSPRLTIVVTSTQRRGAEVFGERLAVGLPDHGWEVDFVSLAAGPRDVTASVSAHPLSSMTPAELRRLDFTIVGRLRQRLREHGTDVVLANGSSTLQYGVAAARYIRRRPAIAYGSIGEPTYWARSLRQRALYQLLLRMVDRVFSVSERTGTQLVEEFGVKRSKLRVLHTGVPRQLLTIEPMPREDEIHLLFVGSLSQEKDPLAAVEILRRVAATTPARLRLVGTGPLADEIVRIAGGLGLSDVVELTGSVDDVAPHFAWADVLLLTSRTEGLPAAPLEAGAAALPVVAYDVGGVADTVIDRVTGHLVSPGDVEAAAAAVVGLAQDEPARQAAGQAARTLILNDFTVEDAVTRYDEALRELLESRR